MKTKLCLRNRNGYVLATILIIVAVFMVFMASAVRLFNNNLSAIRWEESNLQAHYLARSGANIAYAAIIDSDDNPVIIDVFAGDHTHEITDVLTFTEGTVDVKAYVDSGNVVIESRAKITDKNIHSSIILEFPIDNPNEAHWKFSR